jgi:serine/threonine protein kinase
VPTPAVARTRLAIHLAIDMDSTRKPVEADASGEGLDVLLRRGRADGTAALSLENTMALLQPVVDVLAVAHARGMSYRGVSPDRILVVGDAQSDTWTTKLSPSTSPATASQGAYCVPEQVSRAFGIAGPWTDVFALALIVVALLSGRDPTGGPPDFFEASARRSSPYLMSGVGIPEAIEAVLVRALAIYPVERWQTVTSFWKALRAAMPVEAAAA